jgi:hypothetical protein
MSYEKVTVPYLKPWSERYTLDSDIMTMTCKGCGYSYPNTSNNVVEEGETI